MDNFKQTEVINKNDKIKTNCSTEDICSTKENERQAHKTLQGKVFSVPYFAGDIAVKKLIADGILKQGDKVYNPLKNDGSMGHIFEKYHIEAKETDYISRSLKTGAEVVDIWNVKDNLYDIVMSVIPSQQADKNYIIDEMKRIAKKKLIVIIPMTYLDGRRKYQAGTFEYLNKVYVYSDRVTIYDLTSELIGDNQHSGKISYAMLVWDFDMDISKLPELDFLIK